MESIGATWLPKVGVGARVLCVGAVMADLVCHVPRLPERGEGVVVTRRAMHVGGCAFNSAEAVRHAGYPCALLAPVGRGLFADFIRGELRRRGMVTFEVDTALDCGSCTCLVEPGGERTMITSPGVERAFEPAWLEGFDASDCGIALASGYEIEGEGGAAILSFLEGNPHLAFFYGPGPRTLGVASDARKMERIRALRPVWHLNDLEAVQLADFLVDETGRAHGSTGFADTQAAGAWLACELDAAVVVTCGAQGAFVAFPDGTCIHAASEPVEPVDTVGAGDAHLGALAAALAAGADWPDALAAANRMAARVCLVEGATLPA